MGKFRRILISATSKKEADKILDALLKQKLIAGGLITKGVSRYFWKGQIEEKEYYNISAFSLSRNKRTIIALVEKGHSDATPIVAFTEIDGNRKFLEWISKELE